MRHSSHQLRIALLAGASVVALAAAAPNAVAADLSKPAITKAPPPAAVVKERWSWWLEGGAVNPAGDPATVGLTFFGPRARWGAEGAAGFDWQPQAFAQWHLSGQFRYGQAQRSTPVRGTLTAIAPSGSTAVVTLNGTQKITEDHWLVDFAVGRDFGLGNANAQWKLGLRVADLRSKLTGSGGFHAATSSGSATNGVFAAVERSTFIGAGPRFGVDGSTPLGGSWSLDWLAGAAVLFGERNLTLNAAAKPGVGPTVTATLNSSASAAVFNVDAQAGLSYWVNPNLKITASYRVDAYFNAMRTLKGATTVTSTANLINVDRIYNGPMLRLTSTW